MWGRTAWRIAWRDLRSGFATIALAVAALAAGAGVMNAARALSAGFNAALGGHSEERARPLRRRAQSLSARSDLARSVRPLATGPVRKRYHLAAALTRARRSFDSAPGTKTARVVRRRERAQLPRTRRRSHDAVPRCGSDRCRPALVDVARARLGRRCRGRVPARRAT